jgi:hypothetical protein
VSVITTPLRDEECTLQGYACIIRDAGRAARRGWPWRRRRSTWRSWRPRTRSPG